MKKIKQIRYYNENSNKNNPVGLKKKDLTSGKAFNGCLPIVQLGIQSTPGTKFYINDTTSSIIVGYTGVYELDTGLIYTIKRLAFDAASMDLIDSNDAAYLLVDIVYEE